MDLIKILDETEEPLTIEELAKALNTSPWEALRNALWHCQMGQDIAVGLDEKGFLIFAAAENSIELKNSAGFMEIAGFIFTEAARAIEQRAEEVRKEECIIINPKTYEAERRYTKAALKRYENDIPNELLTRAGEGAARRKYNNAIIKDEMEPDQIDYEKIMDEVLEQAEQDPNGSGAPKESKTKRLQLLTRPTTHKKLKEKARAQGISVNELISQILEKNL